MSGWEDLDSQPSDIREVTQKTEDLNKLCLRVLASEDGKKLMDWLVSTYVDVPVAVPGADSSHAFFAEGQRTVVRDLTARITKARSL
jgi:hypothetical protein